MEAFVKYYKNNDMDNDINLWAENTLDPSELAQFRAADVANRDLWKSYRDQGLYTIENIWETVHSAILDFDIDITVGQKMIMAPGVSFDSLKLHDDYKRWFDRYNQATGGDSLIPVSQ